MPKTIDPTPINALDRAAFMREFGSVFEHFPQAAEGAWTQRPFASATALHDTMMNVVRSLDPARQREFLNLHPLLSAANIRAGTMTADSHVEQKSAGLDSMSIEQEEALDRMNADYLARHGFPFIICVRHYTCEGIFASLERRLERGTREELDEALAQIAAITRGRLNARLSVAAARTAA